MDSLVSLNDIEKYALKLLPKNTVNFYSCGANDETTLKENLEAFKRITKKTEPILTKLCGWLGRGPRKKPLNFSADPDGAKRLLSNYLWRIRPRMLRDVSRLDLSTTILGHPIDFPVCISPTSNHGFAHPEAEIGTAKAAGTMKTAYTMSSAANSRMEDIHTSVREGLHFFQVYTFGIPQKRDIALWMMERAKTNGFQAIVLTVDLHVLGERYCDMKSPYPVSSQFKIPLVDDVQQHLKDIHPSLYDTKFTWDDIKWFRFKTDLPLILKGILTAEDARLAVQCGVDAVFVSNHGGRQLDTVLAPIDVLPEIVAAVNGRCEVYLDGGVRHGTDVLKALALGARAVFIGRPAVYGLACNGSEGVKQVLQILKNELSTAMALAGCSSLRDITREIVVHERHHWAKL